MAQRGQLGIHRDPGSHDTTHALEGIPLQEGESLILTFPNGKKIVRKVVMKDENCWYGPQPAPVDLTSKKKRAPGDERTGFAYSIHRAYVEGPGGTLKCLWFLTWDADVRVARVAKAAA